jgi:Fe-S-cluster containining protein
LNIFAFLLLLALAVFGSLMTFQAYKNKINVTIFLINTLINSIVAFLPANAEFKLISTPFLDFLNSHNWMFLGLFILLFTGSIVLYLHIRRETLMNKNVIKNTFNGKNDTTSQTTVIVEGNVNINDDTKKSSDDKTNSEGNSDGYIHLNKVYTSIYAEENELRSENIHLEHKKDDTVTGEVSSLDGSMRFTLEGEFKDLILTGQYKATQGNKPERGSINLRLVDDFLTGFCSFSNAAKDKDPIRVSPYVWVPGNKVDLLNGTYEFCTKCHKEGTFCCCASDSIDDPLLLPNEAKNILDWLKEEEKNTNEPVTHHYFSDSIRYSNATLQIRKMKRIRKDEKGKCDSACHFYNASENSCRIYHKRPIDCRLFPFDIIVNQKNGELHVGYYQHLCKQALPNQSEMEKYAHILRPYLFLFYPYAHTTSLRKVSPKLYKEIEKDGGFVDLGTLRDFLF